MENIHDQIKNSDMIATTAKKAIPRKGRKPLFITVLIYITGIGETKVLER